MSWSLCAARFLLSVTAYTFCSRFFLVLNIFSAVPNFSFSVLNFGLLVLMGSYSPNHFSVLNTRKMYRDPSNCKVFSERPSIKFCESGAGDHTSGPGDRGTIAKPLSRDSRLVGATPGLAIGPNRPSHPLVLLVAALARLLTIVGQRFAGFHQWLPPKQDEPRPDCTIRSLTKWKSTHAHQLGRIDLRSRTCLP